jgi:hypothetical protein
MRPSVRFFWLPQAQSRLNGLRIQSVISIIRPLLLFSGRTLKPQETVLGGVSTLTSCSRRSLICFRIFSARLSFASVMFGQGGYTGLDTSVMSSQCGPFCRRNISS